ncbi:hypothetical protein GUJ93_ZPchr0001g29419 [Zizania palustris]|uniref:Uncharacterized protein n=1 Tax=Zizania palustris TaxID=103762 RepID=A0A8J5VPN1_ZIZPA|nr:hypothetical protein GUJ93_ZPchr0001g29419 [Zizania palustris]
MAVHWSERKKQKVVSGGVVASTGEQGCCNGKGSADRRRRPRRCNDSEERGGARAHGRHVTWSAAAHRWKGKQKQQRR